MVRQVDSMMDTKESIVNRRFDILPIKYILLIGFALGSPMTFSQSCDLTIEIPNLKNQKGQIEIGIYNKKENFPHDDGQYRFIIIESNKFSGNYKIQNLPKGEYAIALMHDENADRKCNRNLFGIPKEGYGFSNNIRPSISAPSFEDCKINLDRNMTINIKLIY
jgi:uncharacterized protein (DUF2141 family)